MDGFVAELRKIPPVTRFLCASSLAVTLPVLMNIVPGFKIIFIPRFIYSRFEIWRLWSNFFMGSAGINYIFEFVMLYRTSDQLESGPYINRSADYAWQLLIACAGILVSNYPLSSVIHARPLLMCLTYLASALAPPGTQTSLFGLVTFPVAYSPYVMLGLDLLMGGPGAAASSAGGAIVGHLWWWGIFGSAEPGRGGVLDLWGRAPRWMKSVIGEQGTPPNPGAGAAAGANAGVAGGVHVMPPRRTIVPQANAGSASASASSTSTASGYRWGSGNRLGSG
ncbi:hypothetical protein EYR40_003156 [Pleurotus pulmonarius]|nr:hypothetical protein EYR40_003156 [Pleurotus pulmonarius]